MPNPSELARLEEEAAEEYETQTSHSKTLKVWLLYSNGKETNRVFPSKARLNWFINSEGDHLIDWKIL